MGLDRPLHQFVEQGPETSSAVRALAFSHDGKTLATGCDGQTAWLWNTASGLPRGEPMRHRGPVVSLAFSPDDKVLLTGSSDGTVRFWDAATGEPRGKGLEHGKPLSSVAIAPDGKSIATRDETGDVVIWGTAGQRQEFQRRQGPSHVEVLAFSPDSRKLACGGMSGELVLLNTADGGELSRAAKATPDERIQAIAFSHDGTRIAIGSYDTTCSIWQVPDLVRLTPRMDHRGHVWAVAFSPDDSFLAVAADDNSAQLWNAHTFERAGDPLPHQKPVRAVAFSPDGRHAYFRVRRRNRPRMATGLRQRDRPAHATQPGGVGHGGKAGRQGHRHGDFGRNHLAMGHRDDPLDRAGPRAPSRQSCRAFVQSGRDGALHCGQRPQHPALECRESRADRPGYPDDRLGQCIRDQPGRHHARRGRPQWTNRLLGRADDRGAGALGVHPESVTALAFNPDGTRLVVGGSGGEMRIWDAARFRPIGEPMHHQGAVRNVSFSPDGKRLASASHDKTARLWDPATCAQIGSVMAHRAYVWRVRFNRDGDKVVTASFDGTAQVWDGRNGAPLGEPMNHGELVYDAVWSDDSSCVLTFGRSDSATLWDAASSRQLGERMWHAGRVERGLFLAGKRIIATCARDGTARLWAMPGSTAASPAATALEASVVTGMELGEDNLVRLLDVATWRLRRDELESRRGTAGR